MNAKALGGGAVVLLGIGGFLLYNEITERREAKKRAAELAEDRKVEAAKDKAKEERVKDPTWATIPNLTGKTEDDAKKALTEAGFLEVELTILEARYECSYDTIVDDPSDMVPVETICNQDPASGGRVRAEKLRIDVVIEHDTFEQGGKATSEWRRMPDVLGMTLAEAQTLLASKGFGSDDFEVEDYSHSCPSMKVCETIPKAGHRKRTDTQGTLRASLK